MDIKLKTGTAGFCGCCWGGCRFEFKTGEDMFESHTYVFVFMSSDSQTHTGVLLAKTDMNILKEIQVILHLYHNKYFKNSQQCCSCTVSRK